MSKTVVGWDIGGAHLKAVLVDEGGKVLRVWQIATPLWQGLGTLTAAIDIIYDEMHALPAEHVLTMTGELVDLFPDRESGVMEISRTMCGRLDNLSFYAGPQGFIGPDDVPCHHAQIASANWFASAAYVAQQIHSGLFVDLGSTTCDLIPLIDGKVCNHGYSDAERMQFQELVYTGVVRTPLMALGDLIEFDGRQCPVAAEHFATTADVYRLTRELDEAHDLADTADGKGKTLEDSARRLARMLCHDMTDAPMDQWADLARAFRQRQLEKLINAAHFQFDSHAPHLDGPIIAAGAGSFLVQALAEQLEREYCNVAELIAAETPALAQYAAICFPAYAVARLAQGDAA
jgi:probable H4MPT-linked C1 transfer pathway protein